ncbi:MAG: hypothetical protein R2764_15230 [Bacteroidales bacterium]
MKTQCILFILLILIFSSCEKSSSDSASGDSLQPGSGKSGSMAKFSISGDNLFIINEKDLKVYNISTTTNPTEINTLEVDFGIETVFTLNGKLFIGSIDGVYIYDISNPQNILYLSRYQHITSCDPVVANDTLAFATLNSQSGCRWQQGINQLDVINIKNIVYPNLISSLNMTNPKGLAIDSSYLFVCDGEMGVRIFDFSNPYQLDLISGISGIDAYDIILDNKILYLIGRDGLFQYNYDNIHQIQLLSNILF